MKVRSLVTLAAIGLSTVAVAQQMPRQDGRWKVQIQMQMPNMPMQLPPITTEQCITPEDLEDPMRTIPQTGGPGGTQSNNCKMTDYQQAGNKITWKMECTGQTPMTSVGEMVYTDNTYAGTMTMNTNGQTMNATMSGVRLGDCTK